MTAKLIKIKYVLFTYKILYKYITQINYEICKNIQNCGEIGVLYTEYYATELTLYYLTLY